MANAPRPRVVVTRRLPPAVEQRLIADYDAVLNRDDRAMEADDLVRAMREADALLPTITDRIGAALFADPLRRVRIVANFGAGTDHVDLAAARASGVPVTNTPDALTDATAETAILLMMMAARRAGEGERELRGGRWTGWRPTHLLGQGLSGKTLGLVGFGRIAQATAARARAFGMAIRYHSRSAAPPDVERRYDATRDPSLMELTAASDVLSLHVPGGPSTRHMIDAAVLGAMRPGAILVNTARGAVVDEAALAQALAEGAIGGAGLDVYEREPAVHPGLVASERAVLLPHLGSATIETRTAMGMQALDNLDAFFAGRPVPDRVA